MPGEAQLLVWLVSTAFHRHHRRRCNQSWRGLCPPADGTPCYLSFSFAMRGIVRVGNPHAHIVCTRDKDPLASSHVCLSYFRADGYCIVRGPCARIPV